MSADADPHSTLTHPCFLSQILDHISLSLIHPPGNRNHNELKGTSHFAAVHVTVSNKTSGNPTTLITGQIREPLATNFKYQ